MCIRDSQHTQHDPPNDEFLPVIIQVPVHPLDPVHDFGKIERHQTTENRLLLGSLGL